MKNGFVLLIVMVYLQVFSLLSMQLMTAFTTVKKIHFRQLGEFQNRRQMKNLLAKLDQRQSVPCMIDRQSSAVILGRKINWWRQHACQFHDNKYKYFYVREQLGVDRCAVISNVYKHQLAAEYYRNTLLQVSNVSSIDTTIIQDIIVVRSRLQVQCNDKPRYVLAGKQMLRWL